MKSFSKVLFVFTLIVAYSCSPKKEKQYKPTSPIKQLLQGLSLVSSSQDTIWDEVDSFHIVKTTEFEHQIISQIKYVPNDTLMRIVLAHRTFQEGFVWCQNRLSSESSFGRLFHHVFADSMPTKAWEQLIHLANDEATIVIKSDKNEQVNQLFVDVNAHREINHFQLSSDASGVVITRQWE